MQISRLATTNALPTTAIGATKHSGRVPVEHDALILVENAIIWKHISIIIDFLLHLMSFSTLNISVNEQLSQAYASYWIVEQGLFGHVFTTGKTYRYARAGNLEAPTAEAAPSDVEQNLHECTKTTDDPHRWLGCSGRRHPKRNA